MKIALVSTGLGRIVRGFETFTASLYRVLRRTAPDLGVSLFQGGGRPPDRAIAVPNLHRNDAPSRWFGEYRSNLIEQRSFALCLYPLLRLGRFDIVHYNELALGSALFHLRRLFGGGFRLLYCNGAPSPPLHFHHRCDFAQLLTEPAYEDAVRFGLSEDRLFLIPYGIDEEAFSPVPETTRLRVRTELGIPREARVVLTVAALKRDHKRVDHLVREMSGLGGNAFLLAAGQRTADTTSLEREAERNLPGRWRFVTWPAERVPLLYGASDMFVLPSLSEAFGLVAVEALFCGLPVLLHDHPVARWIVRGTSAELIDMSAEGALRRRLEAWLAHPGSAGHTPEARERFAWGALVPGYLDMYARCMDSSRRN